MMSPDKILDIMVEDFGFGDDRLTIDRYINSGMFAPATRLLLDGEFVLKFPEEFYLSDIPDDEMLTITRREIIGVIVRKKIKKAFAN